MLEGDWCLKSAGEQWPTVVQCYFCFRNTLEIHRSRRLPVQSFERIWKLTSRLPTRTWLLTRLHAAWRFDTRSRYIAKKHNGSASPAHQALQHQTSNCERPYIRFPKSRPYVGDADPMFKLCISGRSCVGTPKDHRCCTSQNHEAKTRRQLYAATSSMRRHP